MKEQSKDLLNFVNDPDVKKVLVYGGTIIIMLSFP